MFGRVVEGRLEIGGIHGLDFDQFRVLMDRPVASFPMADALAAGAPSLLLPLEPGRASELAAASLGAVGYRTFAVFAIRDEGALVGLMFSVFRQSIDELEIDERTLDAIGRVLDISFANQRLREGILASERRYRELFESSPDALLVQSVDQVVVDANPAALRLYGLDLVGQHVDRLIDGGPEAPGRDVPEPAGFTQYTGVGRRLDGSTFPEEVDLRPIEIAGEPRILVIVRDLTERRRLQAELVQAQKMEAVGLLVAGVAHELNNPLASIVAFSQLIRTDPALPADLRTQADLLVQEANRTRIIVQNLLDFARQRPPERIAVEFRQLIASVLELQSYVLARNALDVTVDIPDDLPRLSVDRSQMQQVLLNLTFNSAQAIRSLGRPGRIEIKARPVATSAGEVVRITIEDDGPGVPLQIVDRLFMPFVTTKEPGQGTGLGLSVSFGIVTGHGGTLRHEAPVAGGARFVIELPVGRDAPAIASEPASPPPPAARAKSRDAAPTARGRNRARADARPGGTSASITAGIPGGVPDSGPPAATMSSRPIRVLVLDDEASIRDFLGRVLIRAGYEPILAGTGSVALEAVRADPPDAILCDHRMAGMSGTEFHAAVMRIAPQLARRFAFMSGDVLNPELREFAIDRDVQLLAKPFDIATVGVTVAALMQREPD